MNKYQKLLILIVVVATVLRLWNLGSDELVFDEGLYAFRSIGYLDYLESPNQTTPIQWFADKSELPLWLHLSFHDHPPLFFLTQYLFFSAFGDSLAVARLPSALAGIGAVILLFLITNQLLKNKLAGIISAAIMAVSFAAVSVARLSMMESLLFFLILLNILFFLKFLENPAPKKRRDYACLFGITLGLCFLTKYVAFFLIPTYLAYLILYRGKTIPIKYLGLSLAWAIAIFSPVIIYNIYSYKTFSHFDLQFGYLLKQKLPWDTTLGGKTQEPFSNILENMRIIYSFPLLIIAGAGLLISLFRRKLREESTLMILLALFTTLILIPIGSAIRFVSLYIIPTSIFAAVAIWAIWEKRKVLGLVLAGLLFSYELYFTVNLAFLNPPDYGVVKLDKYLDSVLGNGRSEITPTHPNPHLNKIIQEFAINEPVKLKPTGLIYDNNIAVAPMLWLFSRRQYYHGLPIMPASVFQEKLKTDPSVFNGLELYFVKGEPASPLKLSGLTDSAQQVEESLKSKINPTIVIKTSNNDTAFKVYKFSLK